MKITRNRLFSAIAVAMFCAGAACGGEVDLIDVTHGAEPGSSGNGNGNGGTGKGGSGSSSSSGTFVGPGSGTFVGPGSGTFVGPGSGSACEGLAYCCNEVPTSAQATCEEVASAGDADNCDTVLTDIEEAGYCGDSTGSGSGTFIGSGTGSFGGSGTGSSVGSGSGPTTGGLNAACQALLDCCTDVPANDEGVCKETVDENNSAQCQAVYSDLEAEGYCARPSPPLPRDAPR